MKELTALIPICIKGTTYYPIASAESRPVALAEAKLLRRLRYKAQVWSYHVKHLNEVRYIVMLARAYIW
jgi:hypothetical protein